MAEHIYDIAIAGGGLCGFACAVYAAGRGKRVILTERRAALGWESTWAGQLDFGGRESEVRRRLEHGLARL